MTVVMVACANGIASTDVGDGSIVEQDGARDVLANPDSPTTQDGPSPVDESGACAQKVVINELLVDGASEWVELYNASTCSVLLGGWNIKYRSKDDAAGGATYLFGSGESIPSKGFFLIATSTYSGTKDATFNGGFGNAGGQVGLIDKSSKTVDAVGYGTGTAGLYTEGSPATLPATNKSMGRSSDGVDTDNNKNDFASFNTPTPGAAN